MRHEEDAEQDDSEVVIGLRRKQGSCRWRVWYFAWREESDKVRNLGRIWLAKGESDIHSGWRCIFAPGKVSFFAFCVAFNFNDGSFPFLSDVSCPCFGVWL